MSSRAFRIVVIQDGRNTFFLPVSLTDALINAAQYLGLLPKNDQTFHFLRLFIASHYFYLFVIPLLHNPLQWCKPLKLLTAVTVGIIITNELPSEIIDDLSIAQVVIFHFHNLECRRYGTLQNGLCRDLVEVDDKLWHILIICPNFTVRCFATITHDVGKTNLQFTSLLQCLNHRLGLRRTRHTTLTTFEGLERHTNDVGIFGREFVNYIFLAPLGGNLRVKFISI